MFYRFLVDFGWWNTDTTTLRVIRRFRGGGRVEGGRDDDVVDADVDDLDDETYQLLRLSLFTGCRDYSLGSILEIIC